MVSTGVLKLTSQGYLGIAGLTVHYLWSRNSAKYSAYTSHWIIQILCINSSYYYPTWVMVRLVQPSINYLDSGVSHLSFWMKLNLWFRVHQCFPSMESSVGFHNGKLGNAHCNGLLLFLLATSLPLLQRVLFLLEPALPISCDSGGFFSQLAHLLPHLRSRDRSQPWSRTHSWTQWLS